MKKQNSLLDVVLENIKVGDIVANKVAYWKVLRINPIDDTVYCKQVIKEKITKEENDGVVGYSFRDADPGEEMEHWSYIEDLDLLETVMVNGYPFGGKELKETVEIMNSEQYREELQPHRQPDPETICYHVEYSLDYARGLSLKEISKSDIIKFDGTIVSKGKTWIFHTFHGYVIIPCESIIHMHPQY